MATIAAERERRIKSLPTDVYAALTNWSEVDDPFIAELVLLMLVAVFHQVERELVWLAAGTSNGGSPIEFDKYQQRAGEQRERWRNGKTRRKFIREFRLDSLEEWRTIEALRLLANCYKHDPGTKPSQELLRRLGMPLTPNEPLVTSYAALPESENFREGLAQWVGVDRQAHYCQIADRLLDRVDLFLADARRAMPRNVRPGRVAISSFEG